MGLLLSLNFNRRHSPFYRYQSKGLELLLKALLAQQGMTPPRIHPLSSLYNRLLPCNKAVVDQAVREAINESATGALPYGLPNIGGTGLLRAIELGVDEAEEDRTQGFQDMDVHEFFEMLDAEWEATISQYMGYTRDFVAEKQTMRVNTRVLAGAIHVCLTLAEYIVGPEVDPTDYGCVLARRDALGALWLARTRARGLTGLKKLRSATRSRTASKQRAAI